MFQEVSIFRMQWRWIVEISLKNLAAYIHHEEYVSVVDRATGYKVSGSL